MNEAEMEVMDDIGKKEELQHSANEFKQNLEDDFEKSIAELKKIFIIAASAGAGLLFVYSVFKLFSHGKEQDSKPEYTEPPTATGSPGFLKTMMATGVEIAAVVLLNIVKKKITEYIEGLDKINDNGITHFGGADQEKAKRD